MSGFRNVKGFVSMVCIGTHWIVKPISAVYRLRMSTMYPLNGGEAAGS